MQRKARGAKNTLLSPEQSRRLFEYNRRVFERYVRRIRRLGWNEAIRNRETGHRSLFETLIHILNVHEVWICYILQGRNSDSELDKLFSDRRRHPEDWHDFGVYSRRVWSSGGTFIDSLREKDMSRPVHAFWMRGDYVLSDALMQTTLEEAHHLGEIIGALWQQDVEPPAMTWIGTMCRQQLK